MLYEQQQQQQHQMMVRVDMGKKADNRESIEEQKLEIVDLSGMSLDTLPSPSLNLATICKLDLSNNNLQSIPESLTARLLNIVILDVHSNQLKSLPNSIGCLSKLKVLNVAGNLLACLPKTIENCRSLEELNANFNKLSVLPNTIGFELVNLKKLSVNSNKLVFLPHSITHLTSLKTLDARLNNLRSLPEDLENLINLKVLNVSQNFQYLETLPYSIGLLFSLIELDISYNRITSLPNSIGCLRKLQKLSVEGNPLVSPPMEVVEQGLHTVKEYLSEKMNAGHKSPQKKKSWVGKLVKYGTFNGSTRNQINSTNNEERKAFIMSEYRSIDGLASPSYMGMFSPRRLFSPKNIFH
ncbi:plant intracellular Ras-group-related LRR protein 6 [Ricinus communis]|uniref:Leucine-rich repeat-containing protein, putative n=1 Tax=Ricinus communis TaxID=3988 RepID=B9RWX4_RICCO|nr:plant intracellular Ras-group-related LRR protein 6 [Ricinus communis]EEF44129.1 leucine-rich repeat-containing protein, putative [Ricinus communis]|eukprot:XP_002518243.1 plant intracellular Ras-group-related LRR protein 6 [Ricinus communis]